ncbi:MAG: ribosome silencing factor [Gammaproteobacteria bacterium]|nr:ribosome silencing factor [Gammaproteobacteria bacterium]
MELTQLKNLVMEALADLKAKEILVLDVAELTSVTDTMIICSGTSSRHVKSLADYVVEKVKASGGSILGREGERQGEWALVDLGDVVVHVMLPKIRDYYAIERLWDMKPLREVA